MKPALVEIGKEYCSCLCSVCVLENVRDLTYEWVRSVHRGASVFVQGALDFTVEGINFDQIDGNGVFFSRFVRNSTIARNSFSAIGDSAILVVGASGRHRTNQAQSFEYPAYNLIEENHVDTNGVWVKQSAAYFKSVTRANVIRNNVFHDGPRSGINYNGRLSANFFAFPLGSQVAVRCCGACRWCNGWRVNGGQFTVSY